MNKIWACSTGVVMAIASGFPAFAQTGGSESLQLEEVVVTAEKREENLQKVSISIQVKEGEELRREGKKRIDEIMQGTVGIQAQDSQVGVTFFVRGVDSSAGMGGVVSAPVIVDGVAQSRSESVRGGTLDLAQAEVMRGPQSANLGTNALAGAISLVSNQPVFEYQAKGTLEVGNFHKMATEAVLNVPLTDNQALRIAYSTDKRDGYISAGAGDSDLTNARIKYRWKFSDSFDSVLTVSHQNIGGNGVQSGVLLSTGHWVPYSSTYSSLFPTAGSCAPAGAANVIATMGCPATFVAIRDGINFRQRSNPWNDGYPADAWPNNPYRDTNIDQGSVELNWTTGLGTVTFLPSFQKAHFRSEEPPRGTSWMNEDQYQETSIGDLRFNSNSDGKLVWQAGLYYSHDLTYNGIFKSVDFPGGGMGGSCAAGGGYCYTWTVTPKYLRTGQSAYANGSYSFLDNLRVNASVRYNNDKGSVLGLSDVTGTVVAPNAAALAAARLSPTIYNGKWHQTTYRAALEWDVVPDTMLYAAVSTGYSPGAISAMDGVTVNPTTLDQLSVGWKSQFLDRRLQLNGELFQTKFHNRAVEGTISAYTPGASQTYCTAPGGAMGAFTVNQDSVNTSAWCVIVGQNNATAPEFVSKGLDMDMTWLLSANDRLSLTAEYLKAQYSSVPVVANGSANLTASGLIAQAGSQGSTLDSTTAATLAASIQKTLSAFNGSTLQNAPEISATFDYQHSFIFAGGSKLTPRLSGVYKTRYWSFGGGPGADVSGILADKSRIEWQQAYSKWDAYTSWDKADGKFTVTGYVKNLENEAVMANYGGDYVSLEAPRTYGVTFSANF